MCAYKALVANNHVASRTSSLSVRDEADIISFYTEQAHVINAGLIFLGPHVRDEGVETRREGLE